jgi:hypothetical protein
LPVDRLDRSGRGLLLRRFRRIREGGKGIHGYILGLGCGGRVRVVGHRRSSRDGNRNGSRRNRSRGRRCHWGRSGRARGRRRGSGDVSWCCRSSQRGSWGRNWGGCDRGWGGRRGRDCWWRGSHGSRSLRSNCNRSDRNWCGYRGSRGG